MMNYNELSPAVNRSRFVLIIAQLFNSPWKVEAAPSMAVLHELKERMFDLNF
jgi:hypothetical protein